MSRGLIAAVIASALLVFAGVASFVVWKTRPWIFSTSYTVRIATPLVVGELARFGSALKREFEQERSRLQLSVVETPNIVASAQALKEQKADVAVVRSDDPTAAGGRTVFILKNFYLTLLVPAQASIDSISSLRGKKIGVLTHGMDIDPMAKVVLDFYGFDEKQIVRLSLEVLSAALQHRQLAALVVVGPTGAGPITDAVEVFRKTTRKPPKFIDVSGAEAIANRFPVYEKADLFAGAFGGSPAVPSEEVKTISANVLLLARASLPNYVAGEVTRVLLASKTRLASTLPEAGQLAAPPTDRAVLLPPHPGTIAFLNGEQTDLLDVSTNFLFLGSMLTGGLGWLAAWLASLRNKKKITELQRQIGRLPMLLNEARSSGPERLDTTEQELEQLSERLLEKFIANELSPEDFHGAEARVAHIRDLIQKKRAAAQLDQPVGAGEQAPRHKAERPGNLQVVNFRPQSRG